MAERLHTSNTSTCPIDLSYVLRIPWNSSDCQSYHPPANQTDNTNTPCCQAILSLFGIGLAQHLRKTTLFQLPNLNTSVSCLEGFQEKLTSLSLPGNLVPLCLDPMQFVSTRNICANIETSQDWITKLGNSTPLDSGCSPDLTDLTSCDACVAAGFKVQSMLLLNDGNITHATDCFYFTILYAAGIVNEFGPESDGAASCIFGLSLNSQVGSTNEGDSALVFGLTGASVAVLIMLCFLGMYFWWDKRWRKKRVGGSSSGFGFDLDEQGSRPRLRPNTALLVTDWAWSFVKTGKTQEALDRYLLKDDDSVNSNPKAIMERFVQVGILCAHVMVALRPTILEALKMLEGDIEVPLIPDRPVPLGHPSFHSGGNTFSISPALSGPKLQTGDMLR
ncbi:receptor-like protein kinase [Tripterygium wilfordii]|uniref:Receptor-like protein kinase n=1 Tax=Tripterygium wilfordii TaxID=458696 RepID=A0A7J7CHI9_TRIWF|nr:receptor-like protein kinase [Tripterygium wilfordii]